MLSEKAVGAGFLGRLWGIQELGIIIYEIREAPMPAHLVKVVTTAITATSGNATAAVIAAVLPPTPSTLVFTILN